MAVMILRPQGLVPNVRRSRELQDEEAAQDEWAHRQEADGVEAGATAGAGEVVT